MKRLVLIIAIITLVLSSCGEKVQPPSNVPVVVTEKLIDGKAKSEHIVREDERITITSLELFDEFNYDGNFSDNCLLFLRGFIEGYSEFEEFETLKITDWEIIRDVKAYGYKMAFNFTVTKSDIDTLPVGEYETIITDATDCYMEFVKAPRDNVTVAVPKSLAQQAVFDWLTYEQYYDYEDFGKWTEPKFAHYIRCRYGENGVIKFSDFASLAKEKFGMEVTKEMFASSLYVEDMTLYITTSASDENQSFDFIGEKTSDGISTVTVQHYADCNKLIRSYKVEYNVDENDRLISAEIVDGTSYEPYGLRGIK